MTYSFFEPPFFCGIQCLLLWHGLAEPTLVNDCLPIHNSYAPPLLSGVGSAALSKLLCYFFCGGGFPNVTLYRDVLTLRKNATFFKSVFLRYLSYLT